MGTMTNVIFIGFASFFADISSEMVYPIIPLYLASVFGATPGLIGLIEGFAGLLSGLLKIFGGYATDKFQKKKRLAFIGYATGLLYKIILITAGSWAGIMLARVVDRLGKGIRMVPRDVLVFESTEQHQIGKAFGIHKAMDMAGSALGILTAYLIMRFSHNFSYRSIFVLSIFPTLMCLGMFIFIREKKSIPLPVVRESLLRNYQRLDVQLKLYLLVALLFTLGNSSNTFLLLRAKSLGIGDASVILLYFVYNLSASLLSIPMGRLSDQVGRKKLLVSGYLIYTLVYLGFAFAKQPGFLFASFTLYGAYTAMVSGVERAYIAEISPPDLKGTMLGMHATIVGVALLPASVIAGLLWDTFGVAVPFVFGSCLSLSAALVLFFLMKPRQVPGAR